MNNVSDTAPWLRHYGAVPAHLAYPERTLYQMIAAAAMREPDGVAWDFFDRRSSYRQLLADIDTCANALAALGLGCDDHFLIAMPTLFAALTRDAGLADTDLSFLRAAFCGADSLPLPVKERFEAMVAKGGGRLHLLEGYGLTEAVTAIMAMPLDAYREGSIGLPFPDMSARICVPDSEQEVATGDEGEICIAGPAVMLGYLDQTEATRQALRRHADGRVWLHTGDLGRQDADGFFYFSVRLKRMIKSSGFNVYPAQVEAVLLRHPLVADVCVLGLPDPEQIERVVAWVVPKDVSENPRRQDRLPQPAAAFSGPGVNVRWQ